MAKKEEIKKVADMTIADVLKTKLFSRNVKRTLKGLLLDRTVADTEAKAKATRLKSHPIDNLKKSGAMEPGRFTVLFAEVLDKKAVGYSAVERGFIQRVGMQIFNETMKKLIADEKARDNGNGDGQQ